MTLDRLGSGYCAVLGRLSAAFGKLSNGMFDHYDLSLPIFE